VAEEVRAGLAELGLRSLDELIGRADMLKQVGPAANAANAANAAAACPPLNHSCGARLPL
jgi:ribosomal protein L12E/L44/L45/RPP1/RPP2